MSDMIRGDKVRVKLRNGVIGIVQCSDYITDNIRRVLVEFDVPKKKKTSLGWFLESDLEIVD